MKEEREHRERMIVGINHLHQSFKNGIKEHMYHLSIEHQFPHPSFQVSILGKKNALPTPIESGIRRRHV